MLTPRQVNTVAVNGKIYAIGGAVMGGAGASKAVEEYDPVANSWTAKTDMPAARYLFATGAVNGKIYAIGGDPSFLSSPMTAVHEYNPVTDTWADKADMPTARSGCVAGVVDGKIYVIGGLTRSGDPGLATVEAYDPATDSWEQKADMPTPRGMLCASVVDGKIFAIGSSLPPNGPWLSTVEMYDPQTNLWTRKTSMPTARGALASSVANGKIYVMGGRRSGLVFATVEEYNPASDAWAKRADMWSTNPLVPAGRSGLGASEVNGRIYAIGGGTASVPGLSLVMEYTPPNPAWPPLDTDGDGLLDAGETAHFGNLTQTATDDPDADGLPNLGELQTGADPNHADTDGDGLNDGPEVSAHLTDPTRADTDNDGLKDGVELNTHLTNPKDPDSDHDTISDGAEVNTELTNPTKIDTDNDGFNDPTEILNTTSPTNAASKPGETCVVRVLGGDSQAEGLDLDGTFLYAFNVGTAGSAGKVRDADFTDDSQPGIIWSAEHEIPIEHQVNFGDTTNDTNLEFVFQSIRWTQAPSTLSVSLDGLTPGGRYKLQLLFGEKFVADRGFDLNIEGQTVLEDFNTAAAQAVPSHPYAGGAIVHSFTAADGVIDITLDGTTTDFRDRNPILSGVTLETLAAPSSPPLLMTGITRTGTPGGVTILLTFKGAATKSYALDSSLNLVKWNEITDSVLTNASGVGSYTDMVAVRTNGAQVYYRARDPVLKPAP